MRAGERRSGAPGLTVSADALHGDQFGTFWGDSEKERSEGAFAKNTVSLWWWLNQPSVTQRHINRFYVPPTAEVLATRPCRRTAGSA